MPTVTLYTRRGCHLCDDARAVIDGVRVELPFALTVLDVDADPALLARYSDEVPVVAVEGAVAFRYRVSADALRDRLTAARVA